MHESISFSKLITGHNVYIYSYIYLYVSTYCMIISLLTNTYASHIHCYIKLHFININMVLTIPIFTL